MRSFAIGFGIGSLVCLVGTVLFFVGMNRLAENDEERPINLPEAESVVPTREPIGTEYSVIIKIKLSNDGMGTQDELEAGYALEDLLIGQFATNPSLGEFDGDGVGFGYFDLYMYTSNPEYVVEQIMPTVRGVDPPAGTHIITHITETGAEEVRYEI